MLVGDGVKMEWSLMLSSHAFVARGWLSKRELAMEGRLIMSDQL
jgi:hypothetical protein